MGHPPHIYHSPPPRLPHPNLPPPFPPTPQPPQTLPLPNPRLLLAHDRRPSVGNPESPRAVGVSVYLHQGVAVCAVQGTPPPLPPQINNNKQTTNTESTDIRHPKYIHRPNKNNPILAPRNIPETLRRHRRAHPGVHRALPVFTTRIYVPRANALLTRRVPRVGDYPRR